MKVKRRSGWDSVGEAYSWAREVRVNDPLAKSVLRALTHYVDDKFTCFVSIDTLAFDTEVHPDTVRRRLALLEQIGAISRTAQWIENGKRNAERRGKRTTDLIKLMVECDPSAIKPRMIFPNGTVEVLPSAELSDEANSEPIPSPQPGPVHGPAHAPGVVQPPHCCKGLIPEHEVEESPPAPPSGGSHDLVAGWTEFVAAWPEPILKASIARNLWRSLTEKEKEEAIAAAQGFATWRKKQRTPPRYSAQGFLREREGWPQFKLFASEAAVLLPLLYEAEGSQSWLARIVIAKIAGTPAPTPRDLPEGRGGRFNKISEAYLPLAQFADQDLVTWQSVPIARNASPGPNFSPSHRAR